jgi:hypothetical protein
VYFSSRKVGVCDVEQSALFELGSQEGQLAEDPVRGRLVVEVGDVPVELGYLSLLL